MGVKSFQKELSFFNRRYSLLSFGGPQLYKSKALPFTYGQYVIIKLSDRLYKSVTVFGFCALQKYAFHIGWLGKQTIFRPKNQHAQR